jgi:hypothetical protein
MVRCNTDCAADFLIEIDVIFIFSGIFFVNMREQDAVSCQKRYFYFRLLAIQNRL